MLQEILINRQLPPLPPRVIIVKPLIPNRSGFRPFSSKVRPLSKRSIDLGENQRHPRDLDKSKRQISVQSKKMQVVRSLSLKLSELPNISSKSWAIFDLKSNVLIEGKKPSRRKEIASLTKIATFITSIIQLKKLDLKSFTVRTSITRTAASATGTTAFLKANQELSVQDLFFALMLPSGNDAAVAIAELIGGIILSQKQRSLERQNLSQSQYSKSLAEKRGSIFAFLAKMNDLARTLGLVNTCFTNPTGLSSKSNYSSAQDVCRLFSFGLQFQLFREVIGTKRFVCNLVEDGEPSTLVWQNTNKLLKEGWCGVKTGVTPNAGPCLASCFRGWVGGGMVSIGIVILECASMQERWQQTRALLKWGLQKRLN